MKPTLEEFAETVAEMRHWQREYFRTRQSPAVAKAKQFERRVDEMLKRIKERSLFDDQE